MSKAMRLFVRLFFGATLCLSFSWGEEDHLMTELAAMRNTMKVLSDQWEKWNTLFLTSLEPRITSTASTISSIDSNIHNLQERAHIWDTFQLHISAWNDQLATMDRKIDILNKAFEHVSGVDAKIDTLLTDEYKIDKLIKISNSILDSVMNLENGIKSKQFCKSSSKDSLFEEFAVRGVLSSLKLIERKVDQLLSTKSPSEIPSKSVLNDISSKVDLIFDTITKTTGDYLTEVYESRDLEGSGFLPPSKRNVLSTDLLGKVSKINSNVLKLLKQYQQPWNRQEFEELKNSLTALSQNQTANINLLLGSYFHEDRNYWSLIVNNISTTCSKQEVASAIPEVLETNQTICSELKENSPSGVYLLTNSFNNNFANERFFNKMNCEIREDGRWTVIQRRNNYTIKQDFNVSWHDYSLGFGDLEKDFWIGNNYLHRISFNHNLILHIDLEDFTGNHVWAEYQQFRISSESHQFQLTIGGYSGNASDSLTSHNGARFSTFDQTHDSAPKCCPCSVSFGGGWWFTRCFEANLNGLYRTNPRNNSFKGLIWEHWLGDYSLKKTVMMIKPKETQKFSYPILEDP